LRKILLVSVFVVTTCAFVLTATALAQTVDLAEHVGWMLPREVSQSEEDASRGPALSVDGSGRLHLLWMDDATGQANPYYVRSDDGGSSWAIREVIAAGRPSYQGSLAVGTDGVAQACWWEESGQPPQYELLYARRSALGWGVNETVVITTSAIQEPSIADTGDTVHIVWSDQLAPHFNLYYSRKAESGGTWADPVIITDTHISSLHAKTVADGAGNLHVVWQENTMPGNEIMYISGTVEAEHTTWSAPVTVTEKIAPNATSPQLAVGQDGMVHVVFAVDVSGQQDTQDVYHAVFPISDTDEISPTLIPGSRVEISQQLPNYASPSIAVAAPNDVHVAWNGLQDGDVWDRIYYAVSHDGGTFWSEPLAISENDVWSDGFPAVADDGTLVHLVWQQQELVNDNDIYYAHSLPLAFHFALGFKEYLPE
jgi:hypothetical protein